MEEMFGQTTAALIDGVTRLDRVKFSNREQAQAATIRAAARSVFGVVFEYWNRPVSVTRPTWSAVAVTGVPDHHDACVQRAGANHDRDASASRAAVSAR